MASKHTPFRLALELGRAEAAAAAYLEAKAGGRDTAKAEADIEAAIRASRRTESYLKKKH